MLIDRKITITLEALDIPPDLGRSCPKNARSRMGGLPDEINE
jgi:hypothetical protein